MKRTALAGGAGALALVFAAAPIAPVSLAVASPAATSAIGGLDTGGFAAPMSVLIYEPEIPIPDAPQGELRYGYSEASLQSGPFATALASSVYPGPTLTNGLQAFNPSIPPYPIVTRASYPGSDTKSSKNFAQAVLAAHGGTPPSGASSFDPSGRMTAQAAATLATASATTGSSPLAMLVDLGTASSTTTMTSTTTQAVASAVARVSDISILGGIVTIKSVRGQTSTTSTAHGSSAAGSQTVTGLEVAGQPFTVDNKGVHGPSQITPVTGLLGQVLPGIPKTGNALLKAFGLHFSLPAVAKTVHGRTAKAAGQGLVISIDTGPFKKALSSVPLQALLQQTPNVCLPDNSGTSQLPFGACLHDNLDAALNLSPIIDLIGNTSSASNAVPVVPFPSFPVPVGPTTPPTTPTGPTTTGTSGGPPLTSSGPPALTSTGNPGSPVIANPATTPTAAALPALFTGISGALLLLGLVLTGGLAYLLRGLGMPLMGAAGVGRCDQGAPGGAPQLRRD